MLFYFSSIINWCFECLDIETNILFIQLYMYKHGIKDLLYLSEGIKILLSWLPYVTNVAVWNLLLTSEISKMTSYWKYSKATICRHMKKNLGNLVVDLWKNNQGRPPKLYVQQKRKTLRQIKHLQEEMENFCVKRKMVKADIPASIGRETVCRLAWKWAHVQRKGILTKMTWNWGLSLF